MCRPRLACEDCAGWSGSIHYAETIVLVFSRNGSKSCLFQIALTMRLDSWNGVFVWFMILELQTVLATWSKYCTPLTKSLGPHPRGICGNQINEMLSLLCYMGYNRRKRDVDQDDGMYPVLVHVLKKILASLLRTCWTQSNSLFGRNSKLNNNTISDQLIHTF